MTTEPLLHFSLTRDESQLVLNGLAQLPYKDSAMLITKFKADAERQIAGHSLASRSMELAKDSPPDANSEFDPAI